MDIITFHEPYLAQYVNSFLLRTAHYNIFIDSALGSQSDKLLPYLQEGKENVLLLTHGHWDHIGGNALIKQYGGVIYAHKADLPWLTDFKLHWQIGFGQFADDIAVPPERWDVFWREVGQPVAVDRFVQEGDQLHFDDVTLRVVELPGHSAGSVGYYEESRDILFSGDALMHTGFFGAPAQYCDHTAYCRSMEKLAILAPETVYTAHTPPYEHGNAAQAAREAIDFAGLMRSCVMRYVGAHPGEISVGDAARFTCEALGKKLGCGACVCVLNYLSDMDDPSVAQRIDFSRYICDM